MMSAPINNNKEYDVDKPREEIDYTHFYPDLDVKNILDTYIIEDDENEDELARSEKDATDSTFISMMESVEPELTDYEKTKLQSYFESKRRLLISLNSDFEILAKLKRQKRMSEKERKYLDNELRQKKRFDKLFNISAINQINENKALYSKFGYSVNENFRLKNNESVDDELYIRNIPKNDFTISNNEDQSNTFFQSLYDMDEQDVEFLKIIMQQLKNPRFRIDIPLFEIIFTFLERQVYLLGKSILNEQYFHHMLRYHTLDNTVDNVNDDDQPCEICNRYESDPHNSIIFCDSCNLAVHQECYGVIFIPEGHWYCRRCLNETKNLYCEFCPSKTGAFKQLTNGSWAHLLCGIFIPELSLKSTIYMETIEGIERIPKSRWKLTCFICKLKTNNGKRRSACVQCSNRNCFVSYHITCAKMAKLKIEFLSNDEPDKKSILYCLNNKQKYVRSYCDKHSIMMELEYSNSCSLFNDDDDSNVKSNNYLKNILRVRKFHNPDKRFKKYQQLVYENESKEKDTFGETINSNSSNGGLFEEFKTDEIVNDSHPMCADIDGDDLENDDNYLANDLLFNWKLPNKDNRGFILPEKIFKDLQKFMANIFGFNNKGEAREVLLKICKYWSLKKSKKIKLVKFLNDNDEFNYNIDNVDHELNHIFFNNLLNNDIEKIINITKLVKQRQEINEKKFQNYCETETLKKELEDLNGRG